MTDTHSNAPAEATPAPAALVPEGAAPSAPSGASDRIDAISAALAKAQGALKNPTKDRTAEIKSDKGKYTYTYATLADGLSVIRDALSANAIAIVQQTRMLGDMLMLHTTLAHASGQWISSEWPVVKLPAPPQVIGSALTYARRYTLFALVGIAGDDDDDDGNAASPAKGADSGLIDQDQLVQMQDLLEETQAKREAFFQHIGCGGFSDMTVKQWRGGMTQLNDKLEKQRAARAAAP